MKKKREFKGKFVNVRFIVEKKGVITVFYIGGTAFQLLSIGTKQGFTTEIVGEDLLQKNIKPQLGRISKQIDPRTLAERLITKYENNPPATGIYTFKYYL
ncbi:MAG: hypothetical protein LBI53_00315 [Candidatus Peribacteria bacterium]|jgi:hypothetical protein|nr:hypothetical protein [Candidatus Peribacteria bacterium]